MGAEVADSATLAHLRRSPTSKHNASEFPCIPDPSSQDTTNEAVTMRLSIAVTAALGGLATASSEADVYLLRSESAPRQAAPPQLQRQLARLIFQQRLGVDGSFSSAAELSSLPSSDDAVSHLNAYGRPEAPLFSEGGAAEPSQLMVILEGLEPGQMGDVVPGQDKAFVIDEAPNAAANGKLVDGEFGAAGVAASSCSFERAINPLDTDCWSGSSSIIRYDAKKVINPQFTESHCISVETLLTRVSPTGQDHHRGPPKGRPEAHPLRRDGRDGNHPRPRPRIQPQLPRKQLVVAPRRAPPPPVRDAPLVR